MAKAYKNFWSLNTDEAVVTGILRDGLDKDIEVLMPLNAQMKDVDLFLINAKNKKTVSIQVKGSKAYEPSLKDIEEYGDGSTGWFFLKENTITESSADYFVFLIYVVRQSTKSGRRYIEPHTVTIPANEIAKISKEHKTLHKSKAGNMYSYYLYVNPTSKEVFDVREKKQGHMYQLSDYLDEKGFEKISRELL